MDGGSWVLMEPILSLHYVAEIPLSLRYTPLKRSIFFIFWISLAESLLPGFLFFKFFPFAGLTSLYTVFAPFSPGVFSLILRSAHGSVSCFSGNVGLGVGAVESTAFLLTVVSLARAMCSFLLERIIVFIHVCLRVFVF